MGKNAHAYTFSILYEGLAIIISIIDGYNCENRAAVKKNLNQLEYGNISALRNDFAPLLLSLPLLPAAHIANSIAIINSAPLRCICTDFNF